MRLARFFARAEIPAGVDDQLRELARRGSIVFVMRSAGWLNLSFIRWLARRLAFPGLGAALGLGRLSRLWLARRGTRAALREAVSSRAPALLFLRRPSVFRAKGVGASDRAGDPFAALIELQRTLPHPIFLVPILYVWSRRPQRLKPSLIDIVLGSPEAPGALATSVAFLRNYDRAFVRMGRAIDLAEFLSAESRRQAGAVRELAVGAPVDRAPPPATPLLARKVRGSLYYHLSRETRAVVGPPFKAPGRVRDEVLRDRALQETIAADAERRAVPAREVGRQAERMVKEIAARMSPMFFEIIRPVVVWICTRLYQGIELDEAGLAEVRQAANRGGLVLCPSHKSHMDYVIVTYLFYEHGLLPPHVAAGINLAFWPFGPIARWCGGFFIRRSFKGDRLYSAVVRAYVKRLLRDGFPQEVFIEGGRSRTGKLTFPKTGLLAMEVDAWQDGTTEDLFFVPIAIDYEKLPEGRSYAKELGGGEKKKESLGALLRARKVLRARHGRIYVQFGSPISLKALAGGRPSPEGESRHRAMVQNLANRIAYGINRASTITPVGLCAAALLAGPGALAPGELGARIEFLRALAARDGGRISTTLEGAGADVSGAGPVADALALLLRDGLVIARAGAGGVAYEVPSQRRAELDFFRNNVLHHFVAYAIVASAMRACIAEPAVEAAAGASLERDARWLSRLFKLEFMYRVGAPFEVIFGETVGAMQAMGLVPDAGTAADGNGGGLDRLGFLAQMVRPYLDAYRSAAEALLTWAGGDRRSFVKSALERAQRDSAAGRALPEAVSKTTLDNAASWLAGEGALEAAGANPASDRLRVAPAWREGRATALLADIERFRRPLLPRSPG
jgi:glycerol-3-phosphate O-acyltransferase